MKKDYNVKKVLYVLRRWKTISSITIIITISALLANMYYIKPVYEATTQIFIGQQSNDSNANDSNANNQYDVTLYQNLMGTYEQLYESYAVAYSAVTDLNLSVSAQEVAKNLTVSFAKTTQLMTVSIKGNYTTEQEVAILTATNNAFLAQAKNVLPNIKISITENPSAANVVPTQDKKLNVFIAFIIGLSISIGVAFLMEFFNNKFRDCNELEEELDMEVIGTVMKENR